MITLLRNATSEVVRSVQKSWKELFVTDVLFKLFAFAVLVPLLNLCQHVTVWLNSDGLLSDADFALLFTQPVGIACTVLVGSVWLAIVGLEQASLLSILAARGVSKRMPPLTAIRFAIFRFPKVISITALLVVYSLIVLVPVALILLIVYRVLLGEFDINFYLHTKPTEFVVAIAIAGVLAAIALSVLLWLHSGWILSLPIALFEQERAWRCLGLSRQSVSGRRWYVLGGIAFWLACVLVAQSVLAALGGGIGRLLIPTEVGSLTILAGRVGGLLLVLGGLSLVINLFATVTFAALMDVGYRRLRTEHINSWEQLVDESSSGKLLKLSYARMLALLAVGLVFAAWIGVRALRTIPLEDKAMIMAHRGASAEAPENTMAAFQLAIEQQADWIEIDVQESADGQVIVMHDSDFMKQSGSSLKVWDSQQADLEGLDIGSWFDTRFADQRAPTLEQVLELCRDRVGVNIELKYYGRDEKLEQRVVDLVEAAGMADQVKVMSLKKKGVVKTQKLRPEWKCGLLLSVYAGDLDKLDFDFLAINSNFASRSFVRRAHAAGKEVYVWTVNDPAQMSQMLNRGVDGLLTDRPALARKVLAERAEMTLPERLLSELAVWLLGTADDSTMEP